MYSICRSLSQPIRIAYICIYAIFSVCIFSAELHAQTDKSLTEEFVIDFIDVRDGLNSNYVTRTISDNDNLKYFATEGGISRFDGYGFRSYKPGEEYPQLLNENTETLFKDSQNRIWIGTKSGGLSVLNPGLNTITSYHSVFNLKSNAQLHVMSINQDIHGHIWVGTWGNGVYVLDPEHKRIVHHFAFQTPILNIIRDSKHDMWFAAGYELVRFITPKSMLSRYRMSFFLTSLMEDTRRGKIWVVGNTGRTVRLVGLQLSDHQMQEFPINLQANYIKSISIDSKSRIWLGSWGDGLFISNAEVSAFQRVRLNPQRNNLDNVNHANILDIHIDKNQIAWLSTAHGGVLVLYPNKGFGLITNTYASDFNDYNAISIYKSEDQSLFIGSLTEGLLVRNSGHEFTPVKTIPGTRINVMEEKGRYFFIGTNQGLFIVTDRDFTRPLHRFENEKITSVCLDSKNNLWIGTQQTGLKVTNLAEDPALQNVKQYSANNQGKFYIENNRISKISEDKSGRIWIATYSGLNRLDAATQSFIPHRNLADSRLSTVIINDFYFKDRTIFLGTPIGLIEAFMLGDSVKLTELYDERNGLADDFICSIKEDHNGHIWMSTVTSITRFDPFKKAFVNFDRQDGVMMNSFHIGSSLVDTKGHLYFGGSDGVISFNPDSLSENAYSPQIVFSGIIVNNRTVSVGEELDNRILLNQDINYLQKLNLGYKQNHLTITFAANDFFGKSSINYQYKLPGFQNEWINIGGRNEISFTGLSPGDYELQIRASRDRQTWGEVRSMHIGVEAPPWATWYAYLLYLILMTGIGYLIYYVSARQAKLEAKLRIAEIEKEKEHDLNEAKISFFTNISHEFRTPLTLILSPITEVLSDLKINATVREKMILVENNARRLLNLINQLLDFRKSEHGLLRLNIERSDFITFSKEVFLSFKDIARTKGIHYKFHAAPERALLLFDRDKMEIVLCNIISNAFKYSHKGGEIRVNITVSGNYLNLDVTDNGIGLSEEDAKKVFDRFYQVQSSQTAKMVGSGIGLAFTKNIIELHHGEITVRSIPGKETCFTTRLLLSNPHLQAHEVIVSDGGGEENVHDYTAEVEPEWTNSDTLEIDTGNNKTETVLIVDDNEDIRKYLLTLLKDDYKVIEADNGVTGFAIAKSELPDIIVSDIMMPEMDGITFCHEIKSQIITSHIPIILLTARTSVVYEVSGLETGADDYVTKPFNPVILKTRINNILENRRKLRGYFLNRVRFEPDKQEVPGGINIDEAFIEKAIKLVGDNLSDSAFGVDNMVSELCMSQSTLYRKLKSLTGLSITGFIRSVRLKKAAQMILNDDVKLSQVAFEVGFNDYKHFRLSFQQQFGCLPSDYKAEMMENIKKREEIS